MRPSTRSTGRRAPRRTAVLVAVGALLGVTATPALQAPLAVPAAAVATPWTSTELSVSNHRGTNGSGANAGTSDATCVRGSGAAAAGSTGWSASGEVAVGHGAQRIDTQTRTRASRYTAWSAWSAPTDGTSFQCPASLGRGWTGEPYQSDWWGLEQTRQTTQGQSVLGFTPAPVTSVDSGRSFLLATFRHYNNPVTSGANFFEGSLDLRVGSSGARSVVSTAYVLHETPNSADPLTDRASDDVVTFTNLQRTERITLGSFTYALTLQGFTTAGTGGAACGATPGGALSSVVTTVEESVTTACLWARIDQVRPVTLVAQATAAGAAPSVVPASQLAATSTRSGSAWAAPIAPLTPGGTVAGANTAAAPARDLVTTGESVTVTHATPPAGWEVSSISCTDGLGAALSGASTALTTRTLTLAGVPEATAAEAAPIRCTFATTYVAPTTLTLVGTTTAQGAVSAVPAAGWGFVVTGADGSAVASGTTAAGAGAAGPSWVTTVPVPAGGRTVRVAETVQAGFVADRMTCTSTQPGVPPLVTGNAATLALARGWSYTCTVDNLRTGVSVTKEAFADAAFTRPLPAGVERPTGTRVHWRYTVTNTGQVRLSRVRLRDDVTVTTRTGTTAPRTSLAALSCPGRPDLVAGTTVTIPVIPVGGSVVCTASQTL